MSINTTDLYIAVKRNDYNKVDTISRGKKVPDGSLIIAANRDFKKIAKLLISRGANPKSKKSAAFRGAATKGYLEMLDILYKSGSNIDDMNSYAIYTAVANNHTAVVDKLLGWGCDPNCRDGVLFKIAEANEADDILALLHKYS